MPMSIQFYDKAIKTLISPPSPVPPLQDIIMTIRKSIQINTLAQMGRDILRGCVVARKYHAQIEADFLESTDNELDDKKLAIVAERSALLVCLKVDDVATDPGDKAHILLAYLGAAFMAAFKESGSNKIHDSINDICSMVLEPGEPSLGENNGHERMARIPGVTRMQTPGTTRTSTPIKAESQTFSSAAPSEGGRHDSDDGIAIDPISSGRSPPLPYVPHYQQSYHPYFYPPTSSNSSMHRSLLQPMHGPPIHSHFPSYAPGTGPVHTGSPVVAPQPQYPMSPSPPQIPPQIPPQAQPQSTYGAPPPPGGMPPGYGMGGHPNVGGFAAAPPPAPAGPSAAIPAVLLQQSQGYISLINEMAMKQRKTITWQTVKTGAQHMPEWTMWLYVDGQPRGQGTAATKQAAKELASKHALLNLGWAQG